MAGGENIGGTVVGLEMAGVEAKKSGLPTKEPVGAAVAGGKTGVETGGAPVKELLGKASKKEVGEPTEKPTSAGRVEGIWEAL
jgi:hypothetical protein